MAARASIVGAAATHVGKVRDHNEDAHFIDPDLGLFLVCDGMGGHAAGEVASAIAIRAIRGEWGSPALHEIAEQWLARGTPEARKQLIDVVRAGVLAAHHAILAEADRDDSKSGMGTTLVGAIIVGGELVFAHAGDSRAYLVRDGIAMQLTEDHTLLARLLAAGIDVDVSGEGARFRSMLTNALGIGEECKVSTFVVPLADGDRFLLCSDGISEYVPEVEVGDVLIKQASPARAAQRLIDLALERGGGDNATAVVVRVLEAGETPLPAEQRRRDDAAIGACALWGRRVTPQQRLRALRIAIQRDHAAGEKLPPHTLGDRVAWIVVEGELVQDGEPLGPGALVYPESLVIGDPLPLPDRDVLAAARTDVRTLALRADDFRELCDDDGELGEALLESLAALIARRKPRTPTIEPRTVETPVVAPPAGAALVPSSRDVPEAHMATDPSLRALPDPRQAERAGEDTVPPAPRVLARISPVQESAKIAPAPPRAASPQVPSPQAPSRPVPPLPGPPLPAGRAGTPMPPPVPRATSPQVGSTSRATTGEPAGPRMTPPGGMRPLERPDSSPRPGSSASSPAIAVPPGGASSSAIAVPTSGASSPAIAVPTSGASSPAIAAPTSGASSPAIAAPTSGASSPAIAAPPSGASSPAIAVPPSGASSPAIAVPPGGVSSPAIAVPPSGASSSAIAVPRSGAGSPAIAVPTSGTSSPGIAVPRSGASSPGIAVPASGVNSPAIAVPTSGASSRAIAAPSSGASSPAIAVPPAAPVSPRGTTPPAGMRPLERSGSSPRHASRTSSPAIGVPAGAPVAAATPRAATSSGSMPPLERTDAAARASASGASSPAIAVPPSVPAAGAASPGASTPPGSYHRKPLPLPAPPSDPLPVLRPTVHRRPPSEPEIETVMEIEIEADLPPPRSAVSREPAVAFSPEPGFRRNPDEDDHESMSITFEDEGSGTIEKVFETATQTLTITMEPDIAEPVRSRAITADDAVAVSGTIEGARRAKRHSDGYEE